MEDAFYLGIDLDDANAVVSYLGQSNKEVETVSMVAGSERYQIPVFLTKIKGEEQWLIADEAEKMFKLQGEGKVSGFVGSSLRGEQMSVDGNMYSASDLLALYLKKVICLAGQMCGIIKIKKLVICLKKLSREATELFAGIAPLLGLLTEQIILLDRKECFYYFAYSQSMDLNLHDICLFDYRGEAVQCLRLERNMRTRPQLITIHENTGIISQVGKDEAFLEILKTWFGRYEVSSVYLTGDGFEGDWMKLSVSFLCRGRRAFIGKNLYAKGACYAAAVRDKTKEWPYVYLGENEMKVNVCLKVYHGGTMEFLTLISAGDNWYETIGQCEVVLDGTPEIDFWLQLPSSREAKIRKLELTDLPERPPKATRLRITARPLSDTKVQIQIKDLGFGGIFESSGKVWDYIMSLA